MLVFLKHSLAFVAVPKTGTTAIESALGPQADIIFAGDRKHLTAQRFHQNVRPFLQKTFKVTPETFAVIRHPEDQLRSWYRYRMRQSQSSLKRSTWFLSFDDFVTGVLTERPPRHARIGSQFRLLTSARKKLLVHHLFAYERPERLHGFLEDRFDAPVTLARENVSPAVDAPLSDAVRRQLMAHRGEEYALYDRVLAAGGHLETQV